MACRQDPPEVNMTLLKGKGPKGQEHMLGEYRAPDRLSAADSQRMRVFK